MKREEKVPSAKSRPASSRLTRMMDTESGKVALRLARHLRDFSGLPSRNGLRSLLWRLRNTRTT
jgi:hypothetical protein